MPRIPMDQKELREARRARIPESIIGKMAIGVEPSDKEKIIISKLGKVYVSVHSREGDRIRPHLRDLSGGGGCPKRRSGNPNGGIDREFWKEVTEATVSVTPSELKDDELLEKFKDYDKLFDRLQKMEERGLITEKEKDYAEWVTEEIEDNVSAMGIEIDIRKGDYETFIEKVKRMKY